MSSFSEIPLRPRESLPPFIIVHLLRHGSSVYGDDKPLAPDGHRQCASFARWFRPQVPYITNIVASPLLRATQTAEEALNEVIDRGVKIRVMDQVSGRYDAGLREQEVEERSYSGPRKERAVEYLRQWLGLRDTDIWDRGEVGEVIIVTHGMLLWDLLGADYRAEDFPNVHMRSYTVERDGNLKRITRSTLRTKRQEYKIWKADLDMRRMEADRLWEEARNISPETLNLRRAYNSPNIMFNVGEITIEEAVRQDRASQICNLIHLKPSEIADVRKLCQVPGVGWRDAIFAAPRRPPQDEISRDGTNHTRTPDLGDIQDRDESITSGQVSSYTIWVSCCLVAALVLVLSWWF